jgi:O-antigen ligase
VTIDNAIFGFGIGNAPLFNVPGVPIPINSHNLLLYLVQDFGGLAALAFLVLIGNTLSVLYKESRATDVNEDYRTMLPYFFVALLVWFAYSMTSSLSISMHTANGNHFEETMVFYSVLYLSWFGVELSYEKRKQLIVRSPSGRQSPVRFIMPSRPGGSSRI